jgi:glycosyltransferase involved in cell wall biosynthesis
MPASDSISVVLPVHAGASPEHFGRALRSLVEQTLLPTEVVIVRDGPLLPGHEQALDEVREHLVLVEVTLAGPCGAGPANQAGVSAASGTWIAKMDSDDIALPERFERQLAAAGRGALDLLGTSMWEFEGTEANITGLRRLPSSGAAILGYARTNNPINHPTAFYRRDLALAVGGYVALPYLEDYDFTARMLVNGARAANLEEPLLLFRSGDDVRRRRRAWGIFASERLLQRNLVAYGLVSRRRSVVNLVARTAYRALPPAVARRADALLFHDRAVRPPTSALDGDDQQGLGDGPQGGEPLDGGHS